ncbi:MAG: SufS family cysteine desulfurase [Chlamydiales bacterium]|nr:SufS family cysteine desulfurase [Chlamydiales bacterium]
MTTFPRLNCVYLDSAATTLKPECVIEAIADFYRNHDGTVHRAVYSLAQEATALYEEARTTVARFVNSSEEIIFTRGTTASLNLLARSLRPKKVVVTETEHHSNIVPWQLVGAQVVPIPVNDCGELILDNFEELIEGADLVSLAHISNVTGTIHPIEEIIARAHARGVLVAIDGAQAVAHMPVDVSALDCDFYAFSAHKMYGPTGIGVLYGKRTLLEKMPPVEGGGDMIDNVTFEKSTYNSLPLKFEAGTPMIAQAIGLKAAIDFVQKVELDPTLLPYATEKLLSIEGLRILGTAKNKGGIVTFVIEGAHPLDVASMLDCRGICVRSGHHCSQPTMRRFGVTSALRASFGVYNTKADIDALYEGLQAVLPALTQ